MRRIFNIVIILSLVDLLGGGLLWYGYTTMQDKKTEEVGIRRSLLEENQKEQKLALLRHSIDLATDDQKKLEKYLFDPRDENQIQFISQMEQLGLKTTGALVETRSLDRGASAVHGEFSLIGTWSQMYHVLRLIEEIPTHLVISKFNMQHTNNSAAKVEGDAWSGGISIDLVSLTKP